MLAIGMPGPLELCIIGFIAVFLFGPQLPKVARSIGSAIPEFKRGIKGLDDEQKDIEEALNE